MKLADLIPDALKPETEKDAIDLLDAEHDEALEMFEHFEQIKNSPADKEKEAIAAQVCRALVLHTMIEEEIFYPGVRGALKDDDLMNEALVEHDGAKALIRDLDGLRAGDDMFNAKFTVLSEYIKHHVKEERNEMFPKLRDTSVDLKALGRKMAARKAQLQKANGAAVPQPSRKPTQKSVARKAKAARGASRAAH